MKEIETEVDVEMLAKFVPTVENEYIVRQTIGAFYSDELADIGKAVFMLIIYMGKSGINLLQGLRDCKSFGSTNSTINFNRLKAEAVSLLYQGFASSGSRKQELFIAAISLLRFDFIGVFSDVYQSVRVCEKLTDSIILKSLKRNHYDYR